MKLLARVRDTILRHCMVGRGDCVVVAVSGGADSVCLLDVLHHLKEAWGLTLVAAHFDHGLRPNVDEHETDHVKALAASLHLDVIARKADPPLIPGSASLEEKARRLRYAFLRDVQKEVGAHRIATGHTLDDQAETVLMRLLRGSGSTGLSGIQPVREGVIIRPLIGVTREEILAYLSERQLTFVTDLSNFDAAYLRNDIRLNLIPRLKGYQPNIIHTLGRTADILREESRYLREQAKGWIEARAETSLDMRITLPLPGFRELPEPIQHHVSREVIQMVSGGLRRIGRDHVAAIQQLAAPGRKPQARMTLPNGLMVRKVYDRLIFSKGESEPKPFCCVVEQPGTVELDALGCTITLEELSVEALLEVNAGACTAFLDAERVHFPLMVRNVQPGDSFVPLGMKGHKKLKDFFVDMKIPSEARARVPLLVQGDTLIWVCGLRIDDRFKVTPNTRKVLRVSLERGAGGREHGGGSKGAVSSG